MLQASLSHDPVDLHGRLDVGCWAWQVASSAFLSEPHSSCWVISELRFSLSIGTEPALERILGVIASQSLSSRVQVPIGVRSAPRDTSMLL